MKTRFKILLIANLILMSSCGVKRVYTTGSYGALKTYTEKAHYNNKRLSHIYISGDVDFGKHSQEAENFDDKKILATVNVYQSITGKHYNVYYGIGSSFGKYTFTKGYENLISDNEKKSFYNLNFKTGLNYTLSRRVIDYRFLGLEIAYHNEFGPYQHKLSDLQKADNSELLVVNQNSMLSFNFYTEYVFKLSDKNAICIGYYIGDLINHTKESMGYSTSFNGLTASVRLDRYSLSVITESAQGRIKSFQIGLTYQLF